MGLLQRSIKQYSVTNRHWRGISMHKSGSIWCKWWAMMKINLVCMHYFIGLLPNEPFDGKSEGPESQCKIGDIMCSARRSTTLIMVYTVLLIITKKRDWSWEWMSEDDWSVFIAFKEYVFSLNRVSLLDILLYSRSMKEVVYKQDRETEQKMVPYWVLCRWEC